jgi:hypothetical protein
VPVLTIFAVPNGSGKSSLIAHVEFEVRQNLLEPDAIAKRINPESPQKGGVAAGREMLLRTAQYLQNAESFANHPRRKLDELCDRGGASAILLHPARENVISRLHACVARANPHLSRSQLTSSGTP